MLLFGQLPLTTKFWFRAEKAKAPVERVRNGLDDAMR